MIRRAEPPTLHSLDQDIAEAQRRFGKKNPLLTHLLHAKVAFLCRETERTGMGFDRLLHETIARICVCQFDCHKVVSCQAPAAWPEHSYVFDADDYARSYATAASLWKPGVRSRLEWTPSHQDLFNRFIYVIGKNGEWRYFCKPLPTVVSITRRNDVSRFPFHPVLAEDLGLEVQVAGEIAFMWNPGKPYPSAVLVNNVSGHFRPDGWRAAELASCIRSVLCLPDAATVIALANDGGHISGMAQEERGAMSA